MSLKDKVAIVTGGNSGIGQAVSRFGRADIMVNNAGIETRSSVLDTTEEEYERAMTINLKSALFGIMHAGVGL
jgi:glucose 1-dehydrogenase